MSYHPCQIRHRHQECVGGLGAHRRPYSTRLNDQSWSAFDKAAETVDRAFDDPASITLSPIHLFAQFWYHTKHIGKLGFLEYIIVTPSQHHVHHAINPIYIDKNLAAIFCIWDRMFGTFQEELDSEPPIYGTLKPAQSWNPFWINFQHLYLLARDAWYTKSWKDKIRLWFMPTGWRPEDVLTLFPVQTRDLNSKDKYKPHYDKTWKLVALLHFF